MRLAIDGRSSELIRRRMAGYRHPIGRIEELALELGVLPLWVDWISFVALRPDGALVLVSHEEAAASPQEVKDLTSLAIALVEGTGSYPELAYLRPRRPPGRDDCATCNGAGTLTAPGGRGVLYCVCGGLGWKPESPHELGLVDEA